MRSLSFSNNRINTLVGKVYFAHGSEYDSSSAFEINEAAKIRIHLPRLLGAVSVSVRIFNESLDYEEYVITASWSDLEKDYDVYETALDLESLGVGLYFFMIEIDSQCGRIYGYKTADGLRLSDE